MMCSFVQTELPEECRQKWDAFVLGTLADINKKNTVEFVSILFECFQFIMLCQLHILIIGF